MNVERHAAPFPFRPERIDLVGEPAWKQIKVAYLWLNEVGMFGKVIGYRPEKFQASYCGMMILASVLLFIAGRQLEETDARQVGVVNVKGIKIACMLADEPRCIGHMGFFQINIIIYKVFIINNRVVR